jgi:universal stress protein E
MDILNNIFVVIDPTTTNQRALQRGLAIAHSTGAKLHAFLADHYPQGDVEGIDGEMFRAATLAKNEAWLAAILAPLAESGVELTSECIWSRDWAESVAPAAQKVGSDLIVKSTFRRSTPDRVLLKGSDWTILRTASCPVMLAKSSTSLKGGKVLAAVNVMAKGDAHIALNDSIIAAAKAVSEQVGAELHVANAYAGSLNYVYPEDLAKRVGIPRSRAHVMDSKPATAIPVIASKLGADLVVIGTVARTGVAGAIIGNTAENVLDHLDTDVLVITSRDSDLTSQSEDLEAE